MSVNVAAAARRTPVGTDRVMVWPSSATVSSDLRYATIADIAQGVEVDAAGSTAATVLAAVTPSYDGQTVTVRNWPGSGSSWWRAVALRDGSLAWAQLL